MSDSNIKDEPVAEDDDVPSDPIEPVESVIEKSTDDKPLAELSNEVYNCDRQYAIVLAQLMSNKDREKVYKWLERFDTMNDDEQQNERDLYLRYLILSLNNGILVPPFAKAPPPGLRPLNNIMPRSIHNLIYKNNYKTGDCNPTKDVMAVNDYSLPDEIEPKQFFKRQPVPKNGGIVYAAAFSNK